MIINEESPFKRPRENVTPVRLEQLWKTPCEKMFNSMVKQYQYCYLKDAQPVGQHFKYIAFFHDCPFVCLALGLPQWFIGARDRFLGRSREIRQKNLYPDLIQF